MKKLLIIITLLLLSWSSSAWAIDSGQATVIVETTDAATGSFLFDKPKLPSTCHITGTIAGTEVITIQTLDSDGTTWQDIVESGTTLEMDVNTTIYGIYAPGTYRFSKDATAAAAGLICTY